MVTAQFAGSTDGTRIAYDVTGSGPALMLIHGVGKTRLDWHKIGYVERLKDDFRVITVDLRGTGDSDLLTEIADYAVDKICADLFAVADACDASQFAVCGYSLGGGIARYLSAWSPRVTAMVAIGAPLCLAAVDEDFDRYIDEFMKRWGPLAEAYREDALKGNQRKSALKARLPVWVACFQAMRSWPDVALASLNCPTLVLTGTKNRRVMDWVEAQHQEIGDAGIQIEIIEGLTHAQELIQIDRALPPVQAFLRQHVLPTRG